MFTVSSGWGYKWVEEVLGGCVEFRQECREWVVQMENWNQHYFVLHFTTHRGRKRASYVIGLVKADNNDYYDYYGY